MIQRTGKGGRREYFVNSLSISFDGLFNFQVITINSMFVFDGSTLFFLSSHSNTLFFTFKTSFQLFG